MDLLSFQMCLTASPCHSERVPGGPGEGSRVTREEARSPLGLKSGLTHRADKRRGSWDGSRPGVSSATGPHRPLHLCSLAPLLKSLTKSSTKSLTTPTCDFSRSVPWKHWVNSIWGHRRQPNCQGPAHRKEPLSGCRGQDWDIKISGAFLHASSSQPESKARKATPFPTAANRLSSWEQT